MSLPVEFILILSVLILAIFSPALYTGLSMAPWLKTKVKDYRRINKIADLSPGENFCELGCGDGQLSLYIAKRNPEAQVVGVELVYYLYWLSCLNVWLSGLKNIKVVFADALKYKIDNFDVIYVYGMPGSVNGRIKKKIRHQLKPGGKFLSYIFRLEDWGEGVETSGGQNGESEIFIFRQR